MAKDTGGDTGAENTAEPDAGFDLDNQDRLPWLEAADRFDDDGDGSSTRLVAMVIGGLLMIAAVVGGLWWVQNGGARGEGELIAAQSGSYKVAPKDDNAKQFEGEGDAAFAASEGAEPAGKVDPSRMPEQPAVSANAQAAAVKTAADTRAAAKAAASKPASQPAAPAAKAAIVPSKAPATVSGPPAAGGAMIQLGAFGNEQSAANAWNSLSKRFAYLAGLTKSISPAALDGGTIYRLRAAAGTPANAASLCNKLRVAGENCVIVR